LIYVFLNPGLLFICAGTLDWPMAWVYTALLLASTIGSRLIVYLRNPDTLRERARFTSNEGTAQWDRGLALVVGLLGPMALAIAAGLDHRFGWSPEIANWAKVLAAFILACGYFVAVWAMVENRYFSAVARIQEDRGQVVVMTGPYRFVRHPAYAGSLVSSFAFPIMMGSLWALIPGMLYGAALVLRTSLEDQMLMDGLPGYVQYAERTRYRLIPGVW